MNNVSGSGDFDNDLSRRNVLKSAAGGAAGFAGVSQAAITWAQPTEEELSELRDEPNVRAVLSELGLHRLPDGMQKISSSVGEGEESPTFELWEGQVEYGTLHVGRIDDLTNVVFEFAEDFQSTAPRRFRSIPEGTEPIVSAIDGETFVKRSATEREAEAVSRLLPATDADIVYTTTNMEGFQADVVRRNAETDEIEQLRFSVTVDGRDDADGAGRSGRRRHRRRQDDPHPVFTESAHALETSTTTVQAHGLLDDATDAAMDVADGIKDSYHKWDADLDSVKGWIDHKPYKSQVGSRKITNLSKAGVKSIVAQAIVGESLEAVAGDCGEDCSDCAFIASDLILNCHKCRIFATASLSAIGAASAVLLLVCVWQFCKFPAAIDKCGSCVQCATNAADEYV